MDAGTHFKFRSSTYLADKVKEPSEPAVFEGISAHCDLNGLGFHRVRVGFTVCTELFFVSRISVGDTGKEHSEPAVFEGISWS